MMIQFTGYLRCKEEKSCIIIIIGKTGRSTDRSSSKRDIIAVGGGLENSRGTLLITNKSTRTEKKGVLLSYE